jgi:hypothetical protein
MKGMCQADEKQGVLVGLNDGGASLGQKPLDAAGSMHAGRQAGRVGI